MTHTFNAIEEDIAGDYVRLRFSIEDDGEPKDLSNADVSWALFDEPPRYADTTLLTDSDASVSAGIAGSPGDGVVEVELQTGATAGLSGTVHHRVRVTDSDGRRQTWIGQQDLTNTDVDTS